jgi:hypothetical protein
VYYLTLIIHDVLFIDKINVLPVTWVRSSTGLRVLDCACMCSDRTKFGYSQENEPLGRIALRKYRDRTTENGVL